MKIYAVNGAEYSFSSVEELAEAYIRVLDENERMMNTLHGHSLTEVYSQMDKDDLDRERSERETKKNVLKLELALAKTKLALLEDDRP